MVASTSAATWHIFSKARHCEEFCALSVHRMVSSESFMLDKKVL